LPNGISGWSSHQHYLNIGKKVRRTLPLENSQKKKESPNPAIRKNIFWFWLKGIARWDFRLTYPKIEFIGLSNQDLKITKIYIVLIVNFWLKMIVVKTKFQINQALRISVSKVQFCLYFKTYYAKHLISLSFICIVKRRHLLLHIFWSPCKKEKIQYIYIYS